MYAPRSDRHALGVRCRDGVTLALDVYLPDGAGPQPAVVMYTPYSKDAWAGVLYERYFRFLADSGFAAVLCDFRGTGASGGVKDDAFEAQESEDVYDLIEGLAGCPWCDGNVGICGVSYGGITALRARAARPPHLRALVAIEGSTDPYAFEVLRYGAPGLAMISARVGHDDALPECAPADQRQPSRRRSRSLREAPRRPDALGSRRE